MAHMQESKQWVPGCVLQPKKIGKTTARDFQTPPNQQMYIYIYIFCRKPIDLKDVGQTAINSSCLLGARCYLQSLASWMTGHDEVGDFLPPRNAEWTEIHITEKHSFYYEIMF